MNSKSSNTITIILIFVIFASFFFMMYKILNSVPPEPVQPFDAKPYQDSIRALQDQKKNLDIQIHYLDSLNDELLKTRTIIKYETREKIRFIYTAHPDTLVNIILTNLK